MAEEIIEILPAVSQHTYDTLYDLIFTSERLVAVIIQHPNDVPTARSLYSIYGDSWFGRRKEMKERDQLARERHQQEKDLDPDGLLAASPLNFEIPYSGICAVEICSGFWERKLRFYLSAPPTKNCREFFLKKVQVALAEALLEKVLKDKMLRRNK